MAELKATEYQLAIPSRFLHEQQGEGKPLLIFLHGFSDSASSFLRRAYPDPDSRFEILAPNGPFPQPIRSEGEWKEAYAWYFADLSANKIYIHPDVAAGAVAALVNSLGLSQRPKILCGFSQGGYFLPHLAARLENVCGLLAVGAGFHPEYFKKHGLRVPVWALHGDRDEIILISEARADHSRLGEWNEGGKFIEVENMGHKICENGRKEIRRILDSAVVHPHRLL